MQIEVSFPCLQKQSNESYSELDESTHIDTIYLTDPFRFILTYFLFQEVHFAYYNSHFYSRIPATRLAHLNS